MSELCDDCPPVAYPTDKTRCLPCPRRATPQPAQVAATHQQGLQVAARAASLLDDYMACVKRHFTEECELNVYLPEIEEVAGQLRAKVAESPLTPRVYLVATGEVHEGQETYTRHDSKPPMCDAETLYTRPWSAQVAEPIDSLDTELPCDITVGHVNIRKGCTLRTVVARMQVLYDMALDAANRTINPHMVVVAEPVRQVGGRRHLRDGEPPPPAGPQVPQCPKCGGCREWGGNGLWHHAGCPSSEGRGAWLERLHPSQAILAALKPFADLGAWLFARNLPDETPVVTIGGLNGSAGALTRGHFKAAHQAWQALSSTVEKESNPEDTGPMLDDEGRAMVGASHHYSAENIRALIGDLRAVERGEEVPPLGDRDQRARAGVLWRVIAGLACDVPMAAQGSESEQAAQSDSAINDLRRNPVHQQAGGSENGEAAALRAKRIEAILDLVDECAEAYKRGHLYYSSTARAEIDRSLHLLIEPAANDQRDAARLAEAERLIQIAQWAAMAMRMKSGETFAKHEVTVFAQEFCRDEAGTSPSHAWRKQRFEDYESDRTAQAPGGAA